MASTPRPEQGGLSLVARDLRDHDPARFQISLFAPAERREDLMALFAFHAELARIAGTVTETIIGQMRYQWWRDTIERACDGEPAIKGHPVGEGVTAVIQRHGLKREDLISIIDARETDLDATPFDSVEDLTCQAQTSAGLLNGMAARVLGASEAPILAAAEAVGTAWGMVALARVAPHDAHGGRLTLPAARLKDQGLKVADLANPETAKAAAPVVEELLAAVRDVLTEARRTAGRPDRGIMAPFLLGPLAEHYLDILARNGYQTADPRLTVIPRMPLRLFWSALRKRF